MKGKAGLILVGLILFLGIYAGAGAWTKGNEKLNITFYLVKTDETGTGVYYTPECLSECHLTFKVMYNGTLAPDTYTLDVAGKTNFKWVLNKLNQSDDVDITSVRVLVTKKLNRTIVIGKENCTETQNENGTTTTTCDILYGTEEYEKKFWKPIHKRTYVVHKSRWYYIDIVGKRTPSLGTYATDVIPEIMGLQLSELAWWNASWKSKKPIVVKTTKNITNYQLFINVTYDSDMNSDFSDLRFVDKTQSKEYVYFIQNKVDGSYADIWVRGNFTTDNGTQIYMYYNNSLATSESDAKKVFDFFGFIEPISEQIYPMSYQSYLHENTDSDVFGTLNSIWGYRLRLDTGTPPTEALANVTVGDFQINGETKKVIYMHGESGRYDPGGAYINTTQYMNFTDYTTIELVYNTSIIQGGEEPYNYGTCLYILFLNDTTNIWGVDIGFDDSLYCQGMVKPRIDKSMTLSTGVNNSGIFKYNLTQLIDDTAARENVKENATKVIVKLGAYGGGSSNRQNKATLKVYNLTFRERIEPKPEVYFYDESKYYLQINKTIFNAYFNRTKKDIFLNLTLFDVNNNIKNWSIKYNSSEIYEVEFTNTSLILNISNFETPHILNAKLYVFDNDNLNTTKTINFTYSSSDNFIQNLTKLSNITKQYLLYNSTFRQNNNIDELPNITWEHIPPENSTKIYGGSGTISDAFGIYNQYSEWYGDWLKESYNYSINDSSVYVGENSTGYLEFYVKNLIDINFSNINVNLSKINFIPLYWQLKNKNNENFSININSSDTIFLNISINTTTPLITEQTPIASKCIGFTIYNNYCLQQGTGTVNNRDGSIGVTNTYRAFLNVKDNVVKDFPIYYPIPKTRLPNFEDISTYKINGSNKNLSVITNDTHIILYIDTSHSSSSLESGVWKVDITYNFTTYSSGSGTIPVPTPTFCGNGVCDPDEDAESCPYDCKFIDFTIYPQFVEKTIVPGDETKWEFIVKNTINETAIITITFSNDTLKYGWAKVEVDGFKYDTYKLEVPPSTENTTGEAAVNITISVPKDAKIGKYRFKILFSSRDKTRNAIFDVYIGYAPTIIDIITETKLFLTASIISLPLKPPFNEILVWHVLVLCVIIGIIIILLKGQQIKSRFKKFKTF